MKNLKAKFWNDFFRKRLDDAADLPFLSLHMGRKEDADGNSAVRALQAALQKIQRDSVLLLPFFRPGLIGNWGPFDISARELTNGSFGSTTDLAVKKFQKQHGFLEVDGKAGITTLPELDKILASLELPGPSPFEIKGASAGGGKKGLKRG